MVSKEARGFSEYQSQYGSRFSSPQLIPHVSDSINRPSTEKDAINFDYKKDDINIGIKLEKNGDFSMGIKKSKTGKGIYYGEEVMVAFEEGILMIKGAHKASLRIPKNENRRKRKLDRALSEAFENPKRTISIE